MRRCPLQVDSRDDRGRIRQRVRPQCARTVLRHARSRACAPGPWTNRQYFQWRDDRRLSLPKRLLREQISAEQFTLVCANELGPRGITVNAVLAGPTETDMLHGILEHSPEFKAMLIQRTPMGRIGQPRTWPMSWPFWSVTMPGGSLDKASVSTVAPDSTTLRGTRRGRSRLREVRSTGHGGAEYDCF